MGKFCSVLLATTYLQLLLSVRCDRTYPINVVGVVIDNAEGSPIQSMFPNLQGILKGVYRVPDTAGADRNSSLTFHPAHSRNVVITNNSRTLQKIKMGREGSALTNRPLRDNEVFTVRIDDRFTRLHYGIGIGVTTHAPGTFAIPEPMNLIVTGTWMFYGDRLIHKAVPLDTGSLSRSLNDLKVGQRIGVMRSASGGLHFFLDGVDQGSFTSNISDTVYGVLECYGNLLQGTIIDP